MIRRRSFMAAAALAPLSVAHPARAEGTCRATGDLGLVVERADGALVAVSRKARAAIARIEGLGDLSHASLTYSPDERYAYVFGRDGGLTRIDMLALAVEKRIVQAGNAIGGAISDDGRLVAVSNYEPGGVRIFDAETLDLVADIPAGAKTVGLADVPGCRFIWSTWETGEIWLADFSAGTADVTRFADAGRNPYDGVLTGDGSTYLVGLFGEKGVTALDLWAEKPAPRRFLVDYGRTEDDLPVYKMPHLQGWAFTGGQFVLPAVGRHELLWVERQSLEPAGRTPVHGQPVFVVAQPGSPHVWVNFATPHNDTVQVVDSRSHRVVQTLTPGPGVLHMEFAPRGAEVWLSVRDENRVKIIDTRSCSVLAEIEARNPSGIFFTARAHRIGL